MKRKALLTIILLSVSFCAGCGGKKTENVIALVNGAAINESDFNKKVASAILQNVPDQNIQGLSEEKKKAIEKVVLNSMIDQELKYQSAKGKGYSAAPEEIEKELGNMKAQFASEKDFQDQLNIRGLDIEELRDNINRSISVEKYIDKEIREKIEVGDNEVMNFFNDNKDKFYREASVRLKQIFVQVPRDAEKEKEEIKKNLMENIRARINKGENFSSLASEFSEDNTRTSKGEMGVFKKGQLVEELENTAFSIPKGELSPVIRSRFGYHLLIVDDRTDQGIPEFEKVRDDLKETMIKNQEDQKLKDWITSLRSSASIQIKKLELAQG
jgi:parvulin-like peptidyl-prolyl isomerase